MPLSRKRIQHYRSLHQAKGRQAAGQFIIEGPLLIQEALKEGWPLAEVLATTPFAREDVGKALSKLLKIAGISLDYCWRRRCPAWPRR